MHLEFKSCFFSESLLLVFNLAITSAALKILCLLPPSSLPSLLSKLSVRLQAGPSHVLETEHWQPIYWSHHHLLRHYNLPLPSLCGKCNIVHFKASFERSSSHYLQFSQLHEQQEHAIGLKIISTEEGLLCTSTSELIRDVGAFN